ncbi:phage tail protein [Plesiomonas shigelloides]|uniref:phage tail protein n=1 Tax=Plesiomonas shigelloides TaxID=703 RepID=UPI0015B54D1F|nr:tail fiber protein [Plesiomonas shigelloides]
MDAFIGEIRLLPYYSINSIYGWCRCDGRQLLIRQYPALYSIIGSIYGGDSQTYFNVPNIVGRAVMGQGYNSALSGTGHVGCAVGERTNKIISNNIPAHSHTVRAVPYSNIFNTDTPGTDTVLSAPLKVNVYSSPAGAGVTSSLTGNTISPSGFQPTAPIEINNLQPCLYINNYYICLDGGIYPTKD